MTRAAQANHNTISSLKLGDHKLRKFTNLDAAFGAELSDYPPYDMIPEELRGGHTKFNAAVSTLFFKGGSLTDVGLKLKDGVDRSDFFGALQSMLGSFAPKHEHKDAACAWLMSEYTEAA